MKKYDSYKDSGVKWLGQIPEHWELNKLKSFLTLHGRIGFRGYTTADLVDKGEGAITISPSNMDDGKLNFENSSYLTWKKYDESPEIMVYEGDFLLVKTASIGKLAYVKELPPNEKATVNPQILVIKNVQIIKGFFYYQLLSSIIQRQLQSQKIGSTIFTISENKIKNFISVIPPLSEQQAIAEFLDDKTTKIDQAIAIKEKEINLLKERRQILIQELVTGKKIWDGTHWTKPAKTKDSGVDWIGEIPEDWEVRKLKQICKINVNSLQENTNPNLEFNYVDIGSVTFEEGMFKTERYTFKNSPSRARRIAKNGDTIISTVRTYLKAIDFVDQEKSQNIYSTGFAILEPHKEVFPKFLYSLVKSNAFTEQVSVNSKGMSYPAINSTELGNQFVVKLNYENQVKLVELLEQTEEKIQKVISIKHEEIEKLKEYKTVLIDNVVTGKVKVT